MMGRIEKNNKQMLEETEAHEAAMG